MEVTYLDHMGTDLTVVNAARVSFGKRTQEFRPGKDDRLLAFLALHKHELPFAHPHVSFHFKAPIFVARQLAKHQVGFVWSEISRRYVTGEPELYIPEVLRKSSLDIKQGSLNESVEDLSLQLFYYHADAQRSVLAYLRALKADICPEQARGLLPQTAYTEWVWTGSLLGWSRVWNLRVKPDAQAETREIVEKIGPTMNRLFPYSWKALAQGAIE
jgi:thymidylate synthase (FAD)